MPKVRIVYPQICFDYKDIEVEQNKYEDLIEHHTGRAEFIWNNLTEQEQQSTHGFKWIETALENDYASVRQS